VCVFRASGAAKGKQRTPVQFRALPVQVRERAGVVWSRWIDWTSWDKIDPGVRCRLLTVLLPAAADAPVFVLTPEPLFVCARGPHWSPWSEWTLASSRDLYQPGSPNTLPGTVLMHSDVRPAHVRACYNRRASDERCPTSHGTLSHRLDRFRSKSLAIPHSNHLRPSASARS
jgi:hypothetical protein